MDDLAAWLTQIWDEQERTARVEVEMAEEYFGGGEFSLTYQWARLTHHTNGAYGSSFMPGAPTPTEVLARIAADRQILALHGMTRIGWNKGWVDPTMHQREYCAICDHGRDDESGYPSQSSYPCQTVRLLASAHADRPGYQEAWKPE